MGDWSAKNAKNLCPSVLEDVLVFEHVTVFQPFYNTETKETFFIHDINFFRSQDIYSCVFIKTVQLYQSPSTRPTLVINYNKTKNPSFGTVAICDLDDIRSLGGFGSATISCLSTSLWIFF